MILKPEVRLFVERFPETHHLSFDVGENCFGMHGPRQTANTVTFSGETVKKKRCGYRGSLTCKLKIWPCSLHEEIPLGRKSYKDYTLSETNITPGNRPSQKEVACSNH